MRKTHSIGFNYIMNSILTVSSILFPLVSFPYVSRILYPEGIGRVSFAFSIITYFSMIAQLGIPTYGIRECAKLRDNKDKLSQFVNEIIIINLITCVITYVLFFTCLLFIPRLKSEKKLFLIMSCAIIFNAAGLEWLYKGLEEYSYITIRSVAFKFLSFIGMFVMIRTQHDVFAYGALTIFASVGSNLCNWINARKYIAFKPVRISSLRRHFKPILIFFLLSIASTIYTNLDTVMIGFMSDDVEVGFYTTATKVKAALVSIVTSLGTVLLPRASYYVENNEKKEFEMIAIKSLGFTSLMAIPFVIYFSEFSEAFILVLSGKDYMKSIPIMVALLPTVLFIGFTNIIGMQVLVPIGMEKLVFFSVLGGALTDFTINWIVIPNQGALGAAIGTVIAEFVVLIIQSLGYKNLVFKLYKGIKWWRIIVAAMTAGVITFPVNFLPTNAFTKLAGSCGGYFAIYVAVLYLERDSLIIEILNFIKKKKNSGGEK